MDITENPSHSATSAAALLSSPTQDSTELPSLRPCEENSIFSSGERETSSDYEYCWDPENPENQMGLYENGGVWGPGWEDQLYVAQKQNSDGDGDSHLGESTPSQKYLREATMHACSHSNMENDLGSAPAKRTRTDSHQQLSDFETKFIKLLEIDFNRRALHEEKMEQLASNFLEEIQATHKSLVRFFIERDSR